MKKLLSLFMLLFAISAFAENGCAEHALIVHRLSYWAPEYLTVTNNWDNLFFINAPSMLKSLSVIKEVEGKSTKDMEPEDFYAIIDNTNSFSITYMSKIRGENKEYQAQLKKRMGFLFCYYENPRSYNHYEASVTLDHSIDLFKFNTYDYLVMEDDPVTDKGLLLSYAKELEKKGMIYNSENPDVYLFVTRNASLKIENIWVPKIVTTTITNSTTRGNGYVIHGNYSSWGSGRSKTVDNSTTVTKDMGHTQTVTNSDLFVQFSIMDAKLLDANIPPVVWQVTYEFHADSRDNLIERAKSRVSDFVYGYPSTLKAAKEDLKIQTIGVFLQGVPSSTGTICDVVPGSFADKNGIKAGHVLCKFKCFIGNGFKYSYKFASGIPFDLQRWYYEPRFTFKHKSYQIEGRNMNEITRSYYFLLDPDFE